MFSYKRRNSLQRFAKLLIFISCVVTWILWDNSAIVYQQVRRLISTERRHGVDVTSNCKTGTIERYTSCFIKNRLQCDHMPIIHSVFADYDDNQVVFVGITYRGEKWSEQSFICEFPNGDKTMTDPIVKDARSFGATPQYILVITCPFPDQFSSSSAYHQQMFNVSLRRNTFPTAAYINIPICSSHKTLTKKEKHPLILCTMAKNMDRFFPTWLDYYRHIGVNHVYIYDNSKRESLPKVLKTYIDNDFVSVIPWSHDHTPWKTYLEVQIAHENDCVWRNKHRSEWILKVDLDEFVQPMNPDKPLLTDYIANYTSGNIACLQMQSWFFGRKKHEKFLHLNTTIEANRWRASNPDPLNMGHDKCIIRPKNVHYFKIHGVKLGGETLTLDPLNEVRLTHYRSSNPLHYGFSRRYEVKDLSMLKIWKQIRGCDIRDEECKHL
ncbi:uncharacterized protein [Antedon mediterranea]|uniref:uncharacterized protein n=1 Tax=Antedon mediterranea TaxID=105859 RepID=UPI003AF8DE54